VERTIVGHGHLIRQDGRVVSRAIKLYRGRGQWASVFGDIDPGIYFPRDSEDRMIEVLETVTIPLDCEQPRGRLKYAHLTLRGTL
jgi:hypothetical protein